jgi:hypothetical protein
MEHQKNQTVYRAQDGWNMYKKGWSENLMGKSRRNGINGEMELTETESKCMEYVATRCG